MVSWIPNRMSGAPRTSPRRRQKCTFAMLSSLATRRTLATLLTRGRCRHARPIASHATPRVSLCRRCRHARPIASHATLRVSLCHRCRHSRTAPHGSYPASTPNGNTTHSICTVDWEGQAPASADSHRGNENVSCHVACGTEFRCASMTVASTKVTTCETTARILHGVPAWLMNA